MAWHFRENYWFEVRFWKRAREKISKDTLPLPRYNWYITAIPCMLKILWVCVFVNVCFYKKIETTKTLFRLKSYQMIILCAVCFLKRLANILTLKNSLQINITWYNVTFLFSIWIYLDIATYVILPKHFNDIKYLNHLSGSNVAKYFRCWSNEKCNVRNS